MWPQFLALPTLRSRVCGVATVGFLKSRDGLDHPGDHQVKVGRQGLGGVRVGVRVPVKPLRGSGRGTDHPLSPGKPVFWGKVSSILAADVPASKKPDAFAVRAPSFFFWSLGS